MVVYQGKKRNIKQDHNEMKLMREAMSSLRLKSLKIPPRTADGCQALTLLKEVLTVRIPAAVGSFVHGSSCCSNRVP